VPDFSSLSSLTSGENWGTGAWVWETMTRNGNQASGGFDLWYQHTLITFRCGRTLSTSSPPHVPFSDLHGSHGSMEDYYYFHLFYLLINLTR
jgi:hypothetical protein